MTTLTPECELEIELKYRECLGCKKRKGCNLSKYIIDFWEQYIIEKFHSKED